MTGKLILLRIGYDRNSKHEQIGDMQARNLVAGAPRSHSRDFSGAYKQLAENREPGSICLARLERHALDRFSERFLVPIFVVRDATQHMFPRRHWNVLVLRYDWQSRPMRFECVM